MVVSVLRRFLPVATFTTDGYIALLLIGFKLPNPLAASSTGAHGDCVE